MKQNKRLDLSCIIIKQSVCNVPIYVRYNRRNVFYFCIVVVSWMNSFSLHWLIELLFYIKPNYRKYASNDMIDKTWAHRKILGRMIFQILRSAFDRSTVHKYIYKHLFPYVDTHEFQLM